MSTIRLVYFNREDGKLIRRVGIYKDPLVLLEEFPKLLKQFPDAKFFPINVSEAQGPTENDFVETGKLWCPYCRQSRIFTYHMELNVVRCIICHISGNHYHVRKFNPEELK